MTSSNRTSIPSPRESRFGAAVVLVVDDDPQITRTIVRILTARGYVCRTASGAREARAMLTPDVALVLCDIRMPGGDGVELIGHVLSSSPETAVVMVTGEDDPAVAEKALLNGASGYLVKPFTANEILITVANALRRRALEVENRAHARTLEWLLQERTAGLQDALRDLEAVEAITGDFHEEALHRFTRLVRFRDEATGRHTQRIGRYSEIVADRLGLGDEARRIGLAATMHDVGKVAVPDDVLLKTGAYTEEERRIMAQHPGVGHDILAGWEGSLLETAAAIAWTHHERFDGSGYPRGLAGEAIPIEGRIVSVVDAFDALTTTRPYRDPVAPDAAVITLEKDRGTHFDPDIFDAFVAASDDLFLVASSLRG